MSALLLAERRQSNHSKAPEPGNLSVQLMDVLKTSDTEFQDGCQFIPVSFLGSDSSLHTWMA